MAKHKVRRKTTQRPRTARQTKRTQTQARAPRTLRQFRKLRPEQQDQWTNVLNAIAKVRRDKIPLTRAARESGTDAKTVKQLAGSALRKDRRGRIVAVKRDTLLRVLNIPGQKGVRQVVVKDSRTASQLATYADAVRTYIRRGDPSSLRPFRKLALRDANGRRIRLVTNLRQLNELGHAGVLSFESLYSRSAS